MTLPRVPRDRSFQARAFRLAWVSSVAMLLAFAVGSCDPAPPRELWFYDATSLADDAKLPRLESVWRRAKAAGYSRVVLADPKLARLSDMDQRYFSNVARV